jgi:hypothetical protein
LLTLPCSAAANERNGGKNVQNEFLATVLAGCQICTLGNRSCYHSGNAVAGRMSLMSHRLAPSLLTPDILNVPQTDNAPFIESPPPSSDHPQTGCVYPEAVSIALLRHRSRRFGGSAVFQRFSIGNWVSTPGAQ